MAARSVPAGRGHFRGCLPPDPSLQRWRTRPRSWPAVPALAGRPWPVRKPRSCAGESRSWLSLWPGRGATVATGDHPGDGGRGAERVRRGALTGDGDTGRGGTVAVRSPSTNTGASTSPASTHRGHRGSLPPPHRRQVADASVGAVPPAAVRPTASASAVISAATRAASPASTASALTSSAGSAAGCRDHVAFHSYSSTWMRSIRMLMVMPRRRPRRGSGRAGARRRRPGRPRSAGGPGRQLGPGQGGGDHLGRVVFYRPGQPVGSSFGPRAERAVAVAPAGRAITS
jgi:hypothetical protein